jgi:type IV fimbrial biogenesis protein FimT
MDRTPQSFPTRTRARGFTLLELMLVVAVVATILGIGVPNLRQFILNSRMTGAANDMLMAFHTARTEAIKRQQRTIACMSADPNAAVPACDGEGNLGWVVFVDANNDGAATAGEAVILRHGALDPSLSVALVPSTNNSYVAFQPSGFSQAISGLVPITGAVLCDGRGNVATTGANDSAARGVILSATGRPRVTRSVSEIQSPMGGCPQ